MSLRIDPIRVEDGAWISSKCVIQKGVTIGRGCVVAPLSVVHKSTRPFSIVGGNPAKFIRDRVLDPNQSASAAQADSAAT